MKLRLGDRVLITESGMEGTVQGLLTNGDARILVEWGHVYVTPEEVQVLSMVRDPLVEATKKAYRASKQYELDQLLEEETRWRRKATIAGNKLADVRAMTSLERCLMAMALRSSRYTGKDLPEFVELSDDPAQAPVVVKQRSGNTVWNQGRPTAYIRAKYKVAVGEAWLREHFPGSMLNGALTGEYELAQWDLVRDVPVWWPINGCLDEEEDALYA